MQFGISRENGAVLFQVVTNDGETHTETLTREEAVSLAFNLIGNATETLPEPTPKEVRPSPPVGERWDLLEVGDPPAHPLKSVIELMLEREDVKAMFRENAALHQQRILDVFNGTPEAAAWGTTFRRDPKRPWIIDTKPASEIG